MYNKRKTPVSKLEHLARVIYSKAYRCISVAESKAIAAEVNLNMPHSVYVESNPMRFSEHLLLHQTDDLTSKGRTLFGNVTYGEADYEGILSGPLFDTKRKAACIITRDSREFDRIAEDIGIYCPSR